MQEWAVVVVVVVVVVAKLPTIQQQQLHKQFELHLKPLTSSKLDPAPSTAPSAARIARKDDLTRRENSGLPQGPALCL